MKRLRVLTTRQEIEPDRLAGSTVVVVDIFLATTTLLTILENGARSVFPVASLEEAEEVVGRLDPSRVLRGGEQNAKAIEGYDRGPYPEEYAPEVVADKDVALPSRISSGRRYSSLSWSRRTPLKTTDSTTEPGPHSISPSATETGRVRSSVRAGRDAGFLPTTAWRRFALLETWGRVASSSKSRTASFERSVSRR